MKQAMRLALVTLLFTYGCDNAPLSAVDGGLIGPIGGGQGAGGEAMGGEMSMGGDPDAGADAEAGGAPDQGGEMGVGGEMPIGGVPAGGEMGGPGQPYCVIPGRDEDAPAARPDYGQATAVFDGAAVHLLWYEASSPEGADEAGVYRCVMGPDGLFVGDAAPIRDLEGRQDVPEGTIDGVVSVRVRGVPWVAYGGADEPIRVLQAHRPDDTLLRLDGEDGRPHIVGAPLVAAVGRDVMVFGRTPGTDDGPGHPAWLRLTADLTVVGALSVFPEMTLPRFDDVVAVRGGLLARAGDDGQCVFIGDEGAEPLTNSYCRAAPGGLISDGELPLLWTQFDLEQRFIRMDESVTECSQRVGVWSPYDFDDTAATFFSVIGLEQTALLRLPRYNGLQPLIGRRMTPLPGDDGGVGETTLDLLAYGQWWSSAADADWRPENDADPAACDAEVESGWPYPTTRALAAFRPLPTGCPEAEGCVLDTMNAVLFEFEDMGPTLRYLPLVERSPGGALAGLETEEGCEPSPEVCDGQDNDCDGRIDDGTCCIEDTPVISFDFPEVLPEGSMHPTGAVHQWMVTADENAREYWIFYRSEIPAAAEGVEEESPGDVVWDGFKLPEGREDPPRDPAPFRRAADSPRMQHAYFGEGVLAVPSGGRLALLVRDADGVLHLVWHHHEPVKAPIELPPACQDYMALGVMRIDGQRESVFLACRDRLVRYYYNPDRLDLTYYWGPECPGEAGCDATHTALGVVESGEIDWATITQHPLSSDPLSPSASVKWDNEFFLMVGYTDASSGTPTPALAGHEISYRHDAECDDARFTPCVDHCAVAYESDYCGRTADQNFDPQNPTRRPGWIGDDDQLETDWRACGAEAVTAKTTCCEALFDRVLRETDVVAEERREVNVAECVEEMVKADVPAWLNAANGAGVTDYVHEGWNPCFDEMRAAKIRCCFALDDSQLDCHRPREMPLPALLDRYASSYPEANYTHPFWVAPSKTRTQQQRAVRALPLGDAGAAGPPRFELARRGLKDEAEVPQVEWQPMFYGTSTPDAVQFAPMARRIVAAERGEGETRFWFLGLEADDETLPLWAMRPAYRADVPLYRFDAPDAAGQPTWAFVEGPNFVNRSQYNERLGNLGVFDNTLVEFRPRHSLAGRAVDAAGLFEGDLIINGHPIRATVAADDPFTPADDNGASAIGVAAAINDTDGLRVQARPGVGRFEGDPISGGEVGLDFALVINGEPVQFDGIIAEGDADHRLQSAVNAAAPVTGVTASKTTLNVDGMASTRVVLQAPDGRNITLEVSPAAAGITGLVAGTTRAGIILDHDAPIVVSGPNAVAAGLAVGESVSDPARWRVTARRVFCGAKGTL